MSCEINEKLEAVSGDEDNLSGSGDNPIRGTRRSQEIWQGDQATLMAEEEAERLLAGHEKGDRVGKRFTDRRVARLQPSRDTSRRSSSESSSETDLQWLKDTQVQHEKKSIKAARTVRVALLHIVIVATFLALLYGAYQASSGYRQARHSAIAQTLSNGTHIFAPTTLLLSLDGFRADFLARGLTPTLNSFIRSGISPQYMTPAFPSLTFPNHFTLVTGMHPESHGVVGNTFWDPSTLREFYYTDPDRSLHPEWWNAEPLWLTAELAGVRSAVHMWPGSEAHIGSLEPTYVDEFNGYEPLSNKIDRILQWLDLPGEQDVGFFSKTPRPQFIAAYIPNVDRDGHKYGPNSTTIRKTIAEVDQMLETLFHGIEERNLTNIVNIIIVSDHGMATTSNQRLVQLEDLLDLAEVEHTDGWPLYGLRPYNNTPEHLNELYKSLLEKSQSSLEIYGAGGAFDVYLRDLNMPARFHFTQNKRIAPLWIIPRVGWAIVTKNEFDVAAAKEQNLPYHPKGLHGYDSEHPLMRAIFVARGPAFPHYPGSRVSNFQSIEVYGIVCDSLGIKAHANNGTLRLPLRTHGLHDFDAPFTDVPEDWPDIDPEVDLGEGKAGIFGVPPAVSTDSLSQVEDNPTMSGSALLDAPSPTRPVVRDSDEHAGS